MSGVRRGGQGGAIGSRARQVGRSLVRSRAYLHVGQRKSTRAVVALSSVDNECTCCNLSRGIKSRCQSSKYRSSSACSIERVSIQMSFFDSNSTLQRPCKPHSSIKIHAKYHKNIKDPPPRSTFSPSSSSHHQVYCPHLRWHPQLLVISSPPYLT